MSETTGPEGHVHHYHATCHWAGDTTMGYESYDRAHTCSAPPSSTELMLSADPAFLGHPQKLNPEQLVVVEAADVKVWLENAMIEGMDVVLNGMNEVDTPAEVEARIVRSWGEGG
jgi:hypothetical protein